LLHLPPSDGDAKTQASGVPAATNGYVYARNSFDMRLDVKGASEAAGAPVIQWCCNGGTNQEWFLTRGTV
jgi:galactose oxidase